MDGGHRTRRVYVPALQLLVAGMLVIGSPVNPRAQPHGVETTGTHIATEHDRIPRFCAAPTVTAIASGAWSNPATWSPPAVPGTEAAVLIPNDVEVRYDAVSDTEIDCIEVAGILRWATSRDTRLRFTNLQVLPSGQLIVGDEAAPISTGALAELIVRDVPLDVAGNDPAQYGSGLQVFGRLTVHGRPMERTYLRFSREASEGQSGLELESTPTGWQSGDRLLVPDTRQIPFRKNQTYTSQAEEPQAASIGTGAVLLTTPLGFNHHGPRDANGNVGETERGMLPHIGNLSRNVVFRSSTRAESGKDRYCMAADNIDNPGECVTRGHVMLLARAEIDVRYAAFLNLGRTTVDELDNTQFDDVTPIDIGRNQVGRYSVHVHHLTGPANPDNTGYQFKLIGNAIEGFLKWGITVHNSHYGLVKDNVLYDGHGSAIATEDGNESFNVFERNFVVHTKAGTTHEILESPGRAGVTLARRHFGFTADGFWFSGMNNYVRDNVVANTRGFAYNYNGYYLTQAQPVPNFRGADMRTEATVQTALPVLESTRNEAYGATGQGLWLTWSRGCCRVDTYRDVSLFKDYRIWHVNHTAVEAYHENRNTFEGFVLRNDPEVSARSGGGSLRFNRGFNLSNRSYENGQTVVRGLDAQGFNIGVQLPRRPEDGTEEPNVMLLADSFLKNYLNVQEHLPNIGVKRTTIRNVIFEPLDMVAIPGLPAQPRAIEMHYSVDRFTSFVDRRSSMVVHNFNRIGASDFEVFFEEQGPEFPIPPPPDIEHVRFHGCPESDLTNRQCMDQHGVAVSGAVAPCLERDGDASCAAAKARAAALGIEGLVFPLETNEGLPPPPNFKVVSR